jgi:hypothetical protein
MVVMGCYETRPERLAVSSLRAKPARSLELRTLWRLYSYETLLERLPQDLEPMACERRELIEEEDAMRRQRHLPRHGDLAPTDHADVRDGVVRGATRLGGDNGGAGAGEAGDAVDAGGFEGFGQAHVRQRRRQPARQPRLPHSRWRQEEEVMVTTPAHVLPCSRALAEVLDHVTALVLLRASFS